MATGLSWWYFSSLVPNATNVVPLIAILQLAFTSRHAQSLPLSAMLKNDFTLVNALKTCLWYMFTAIEKKPTTILISWYCVLRPRWALIGKLRVLVPFNIDLDNYLVALISNKCLRKHALYIYEWKFSNKQMPKFWYPWWWCILRRDTHIYREIIVFYALIVSIETFRSY